LVHVPRVAFKLPTLTQVRQGKRRLAVDKKKQGRSMGLRPHIRVVAPLSFIRKLAQKT